MDKPHWIDSILIALAWIGCVCFVIALLDCAGKTIKAGISIF